MSERCCQSAFERRFIPLTAILIKHTTALVSKLVFEAKIDAYSVVIGASVSVPTKASYSCNRARRVCSGILWMMWSSYPAVGSFAISFNVASHRSGVGFSIFAPDVRLVPDDASRVGVVGVGSSRLVILGPVDLVGGGVLAAVVCRSRTLEIGRPRELLDEEDGSIQSAVCVLWMHPATLNLTPPDFASPICSIFLRIGVDVGGDGSGALTSHL